MVSATTQCSGIQVANEVTVRLIEALCFNRACDASRYVSQGAAVSQQCLPASQPTFVCTSGTAEQLVVQGVDRCNGRSADELGGVQEAVGEIGQRCAGIRCGCEALSATQICVTTQQSFKQTQSRSFSLVLCQDNSFNSAGSRVDESQELSASDRCSLCTGQVDVEVVASAEAVVSNRTVQLYNVEACASIDDVCVVGATQNDGVITAAGDDVVVVVVASTSDNSVVTVASDDGVVASTSVDVVVLIAIDDDYVVARTSGQQELSGSRSISRNSNASQRGNVGSSISSEGRSDVDAQVGLAVQNDCLGSSHFSGNIQGNEVATCTSDGAGDNVGSTGLTSRDFQAVHAFPASQVYSGSAVQSQQSADCGSGAVGQAGSGQERAELGCGYRGILLHGKFLLLQAFWPVLLIFCVNAEFSHGDL
ncbi:hypothetical protein ALP07_05552 [Pseudomonas savastanoi pv. glycinea]|nr:hypothetical protein ALQ01_05592 [Pseudomonas savastanoi pv. glycinea]RMV68520.1 hypothetical protein ALP07_05552 [Pseudomonas savastanoi pv. glycinea]